MNFITSLFKIEKKPKKGLIAVEWVTMAYLLFTLVIVLFAYTRVENPQAMIWGRVRIAAMTVALWGAYRLVPCRLTRCVRIVTQLALLGWWYPDTYEINRMFPNLDHVFVVAEQQLFGCQPAVYFAQTFSSNVVSELMSMGYASYYPMILVVVLFYFFCRYTEFERCALVVLASFSITLSISLCQWQAPHSIIRQWACKIYWQACSLTFTIILTRTPTALPHQAMPTAFSITW